MKLALGVIEVVTKLQSQFLVRLFHSPKLIDPLSPSKAADNTITLKNLTYTRKSNEQENLSNNYIFIYSSNVLLALPTRLWPELDVQRRRFLDQQSH